jgi:metacaspase-1
LFDYTIIVMSQLESQIQNAIPAEFHMISGSHDSQTSADVANVGSKFELPNPAGRAGGACTSALLKVLYRDEQVAGDLTWVQLLRQMRTELLGMGFDQVPQLTSSRMVDVEKIMYIVPPGCTGRRRAVLIGINYVGQQGQLSGCHNDLYNIKNYLTKAQGFNEGEMLILCDDGKHHPPTRKNIEDAFRRITEYSQAGDVVFVHVRRLLRRRGENSCEL